MRVNEDDQAAPQSSATPSSTTATASPSHAAATAASSKPSRPINGSQLKSISTSDATFVKKNLFEIPSDHRVEPGNPPDGRNKGYKMKEDDMWTKLFTL